MKKILKSLFLVFVLVVLVAGATRAVWTDQAEIQGNQFTSGNADLDLWDGSDWQDNINSFVFDNIYPGWTKDFTFKVKNNSTANVSLGIIAKLKSLSTDYGPMRDNVMLKFSWNGGVDLTGEYSLKQWYDGQASLGSLDKGEQRTYTAHFRLKSEVGDAFQGKTVNFVVLLDATQQ